MNWDCKWLQILVASACRKGAAIKTRAPERVRSLERAGHFMFRRHCTISEGNITVRKLGSETELKLEFVVGDAEEV